MQTKLIGSNELSGSKGLKDGSVISLTYPTLVLKCGEGLKTFQMGGSVK